MKKLNVGTTPSLQASNLGSTAAWYSKSMYSKSLVWQYSSLVVTERQVGKMEVAELKIMRWAMGVTRKDKIRNEYVRETAKIAKLGNKLRNARLRWYGYVKKREEDYVGKRDDGDGGARQKEKRKAKEKLDRFGERRHGKG